MNEPALILKAQHGSLDAFNHLVLTYQDALFATALRILGDDELAADATQDAFISAFYSINCFRGSSFRAWLTRIIRNACYDELRRQKRHRTVRLEPIDSENQEVEIPRWLADTSMLPEERIDAAELELAIQHCLNTLPTDFRTVIVLADIQGMTYSEVAYAMSIPLGTMKSRLVRARLRLREKLQGFRELLPTAFHINKQGLLMQAE